MRAIKVRSVEQAWRTLQSMVPIMAIQTQEQYEEALGRLDDLLDVVGQDEDHPLYEVLDTLGTLIHAYEEEHVSIPHVRGIDVLRYLMEEHGLKQYDLPEVGSQGVVSELLTGKREINKRQIQALSARFNVSPAVFFS